MYRCVALTLTIKAASKHVQIIVATQSVALLDRFSADDVVVVNRRNRESEFHRLSADALKKWLAEYTLSELWEKNVFGGRPGV